MGKTRIIVDCIDQRLVIMNDPLLASGGQNEDEIEFNFCPLWDGFGKTAVFYRTPAEVYNSSIVNNRCIIPAEVLVDKGEIFFGVFGSKGDATRTSEVIKYNVVQGALLSGKKPAEPTPDVYSQLMTRFGEVEQKAANAVQKTGDTMTGDLTTTGLIVTPGHIYPVTKLMAFPGGDSVTYGAAMDEQFIAQIVYEDTRGQREYYILPPYSVGRTGSEWYYILTSKNPVTIAQGGTGAKDAAGAVANLWAEIAKMIEATYNVTKK